MKSIIVVLIVGLVLGTTVVSFAIYQMSLDGIPLLPTKPFRLLITGEHGELFVYDGRNLSPVDLSTFKLNSTHLIAADWRHDGSYGLISGTNGTLLKYDGTFVERIETGLNSSIVLHAISWKPDDSQALIAGNKGILLSFDGTVVTRITANTNETMFAVRWRPGGTTALLSGTNGFIAEYDGTSVLQIPSPVSLSLHDLEWHPSGSYALIGGTSATLLKYDGRILTRIYALESFGGDPRDAHEIRDITFSSTTGVALITGAGGFTMSYDEGKVHRTEFYTDLEGNLVDLHQIGDFRAAKWVEGSLTAFAVGENGIIARITNMAVTLVRQGAAGTYFRDIISF